MIRTILLATLVLASCERPAPTKDLSPTPEQTQGAQGAAPGTKLGDLDGLFRQRFDAEAVDESWAGGREDTIRSLINALDGTRVTSVECRETVCEVKLSFDSRAVMNSFDEALIRRASDLFPPNGASRLMFQEPETLTARMWLTREGYSHPGPNGEKGKYTPAQPATPEEPGGNPDAGPPEEEE